MEISANSFSFAAQYWETKRLALYTGLVPYGLMISIPSPSEAAKSRPIRSITSSMPSPRMPLMVKVMVLAFSMMAVSLFRTGVSGSAGEKAAEKPSKIRPGSISTKSTGSSNRTAAAARIFPISLRPSHSAPAAAP